MLPSTVRETNPDCCATCKWSGHKRGIMSLLCFHAEPEQLDDDDLPLDEDGELLEGDRLDKWWCARITDLLSVCDEFTAA